MVINRKAIELGDLFEFDSNIVQIVEMEELPELYEDIEQWKQITRNLNVTINYLSIDRTVGVKIESLKPIPIWYPSVDFTKTLGFVKADYPYMQFLQAEKLQDILLFRLLFLNDEGFITGTNYAVGKISDLDKIQNYHDYMNPEVRKEFEAEFSPVKDLNTLLFGLKLNSVSFDLNLIRDFFYNTYIPNKSNLSSF